MLVVRKCRALARGSDGHKTVGSLGDLPIDEVAKRALIKPAILEWRDQGDK
jgi:hypothetical protein